MAVRNKQYIYKIMFVENHKSYEHNGDKGKIILSWWAYTRHILTTWKHIIQFVFDYPEDGGSTLFCNTHNYLLFNMASLPRLRDCSSKLLWKSHILQNQYI